MAPSSALPIGATRTVNEMQPITLDPASPGSGLLNAIVALLALPSHPEETERYDEEVLDLPVSGFLAMFVFTLFIVFRRPDWGLKHQRGRAQSKANDLVPKSRNVCREDCCHGFIRMVGTLDTTIVCVVWTRAPCR
jgi:hypothetical protein